MQPSYCFQTKNQQLWLSPERCIYWEEQQTLILSDAHFGKTGHFRKSGIAVPQAVFREDLQRLVTILHYFQPKRLVIVGDLFHSKENKELELFRKWREDFYHIEVHLVLGNHDILGEDWYRRSGIEVHCDRWHLDSFEFIHDIGQTDTMDFKEKRYFFSGHIHPGIRLNGLGKQSLSFPCFYFGKSHAVLPAFSRFAGHALIEPKRGEQVFAIMNPHAPRRGSAAIVQIQ